MVVNKKNSESEGIDNKEAEGSHKKTTPNQNLKLWQITSLVLGVLCFILLIIAVRGGITGQVILSEEDASDKLVDFLNNLVPEGEVVFVSTEDLGSVYEVTISYQGELLPVHVTKDGKYFIQGLQPITTGQAVQEEPTRIVPEQTILECARGYELSEDTIIFYYSDSCGWCSRMKPGVDSLEERGYNIYRADASKGESLITECVSGHMESNGIPQFICVKTGEIKVGAFTDSQGNLNQDAMDTWAESCLAE
jgi:hypothetical protein